MIHSPCYDTKTETTCPNRQVGCRADCKAWQEYEALKKKEYTRRDKERQLKNDLCGYVNTRYKRVRRRKHIG